MWYKRHNSRLRPIPLVKSDEAAQFGSYKRIPGDGRIPRIPWQYSIYKALFKKNIYNRLNIPID